MTTLSPLRGERGVAAPCRGIVWACSMHSSIACGTLEGLNTAQQVRAPHHRRDTAKPMADRCEFCSDGARTICTIRRVPLGSVVLSINDVTGRCGPALACAHQ